MSWAWLGLPLLALLVLWVWQRRHSGRLARPVVARRSGLSDTSVMATDWADGPDTFPMDGGACPEPARHSEFRNSQQPVLDSWFNELTSDFAPTEPLAQPPVQQAMEPPGEPVGQPSARPENTVPPLSQPGLGRYRIDKPLGKGAMGAVYHGHDPATGQHVALKTMALSREFSGGELADARSRFLREAEMAGRLHHPDIVGILDAGETDGIAYIAMELVEGVTLSHHTQPGRLLPTRQVLGIVARVAEALAYAHTRGVTHRDVKPANIMVDLAHDVVKVMDFGVARVADATRTRTGVVLGTPTFMSPEQLSGQPIDGRSDLYSLGVTMFQLLTGKLPYPNESMGALMRAIGREPPLALSSLRPDLPPALGDIVALALQKHPSTRYASGQHMADDLRAVLRSLPA